MKRVIKLSTLSDQTKKLVHKELSSLSRPTIVVDAQPAYAKYADGVAEDVVEFVCKQGGRILLLVNAEDQGLTDDTVSDIIAWWDETAEDRGLSVDWDRISIVDKGYDYLRSWMDSGISDDIIIQTLQEMSKQNVNDSRDLLLNSENESHSDIIEAVEQMEGDPLQAPSNKVVTQLKKFNNSYLIGGARHECLKEVELLLEASNLKYQPIDHLIY